MLIAEVFEGKERRLHTQLELRRFEFPLVLYIDTHTHTYLTLRNIDKQLIKTFVKLK